MSYDKYYKNRPLSNSFCNNNNSFQEESKICKKHNLNYLK